MKTIKNKLNNWFKNTTLIKSIREEKMMDRFNILIKIKPVSIDFVKEDNGWNFYNVKTEKSEYSCFLSSSDNDVINKFKHCVKNSESENYWLDIGKVNKTGKPTYLIQELNIKEI